MKISVVMSVDSKNHVLSDRDYNDGYDYYWALEQAKVDSIAEFNAMMKFIKAQNGS